MPAPLSATKRSVFRHAPLVARVLLGLLFAMTGLNGFLNFLPPPAEPMPQAALAFAGAMTATGYLFQLTMGTQLLAGIMLLFNCFAPLALTLLAPIIVNILAFHFFLAPSGLLMAVVVLALELYLAWVYRKAFKGLFCFRFVPGRNV